MGIDTLQDLRDVTIISFCIAGTVLFLIAIIFTVVIGWGTKSTVSKVKGVVSDSVQPTLENVRETTENVRGTVAFVSDHAVTPVVRTYGIIAGARRFMVVVSRFRRRSEE
jgi:SNF family Na+-dependent transporter